ncbi:MAG: alkaline phosphatase family protein [Planctomycetota bacterium]|jgi:predicted AlkP superfamily phosphohydrolase/phosphomutase
MTLRVLLLSVLLLAAANAPAQDAAPAGGVPKTIILGFDGMDHALTERFMADGTMPNFKRLADQGQFRRLETSNPAQSPVSWAVFNTGTNPGKTGVAGFVSRMFSESKPERPGIPLPQPMLGFSSTIPADDFVRFPLALSDPTSFLLYAVLVALAAGLVLFKLLFRLKLPLAALLALGCAGAAGWWADGYAARLPADGQLPYTINPMQGTNFWSWLDEAGIRMRGVQVASTYPPDDEGPNTQLLSGLGVPDISGSPGSWFVYTNDKYKFSDQSTATAGKIIKLYEDVPGRLDAELHGPRNWYAGAAHKADVARIQAELDGGGLSPERSAELEEQLADAKRGVSAASAKTTTPFAMRLDTAGHAVEFFVGAAAGSALDGPGMQGVRVEQGGWSDFVPVEFPLGGDYSAKGLVSFHVLRCDEEETRIFVPPINIDPLGTPPQMPISAPPDFAAQLQHEIGHPYETLGWACITNPLKDIDDSKLPEQSFLDDIVTTEALREELLMAGLERSDTWDVYFQVFSTTDRVCHMLFRETDPEHPAYDEELANTMVTAWGESFPLKDAVRQVYKDEDRLLGRVLEQLDAGAFGPDCLLMVVSDHGFTSFRRQVNLNNALFDMGYLAFQNDMSVSDVLSLSGRQKEFLAFVDWPRTRAYSLGLGEVFVNLEGREPRGVVPPEQYDEVVEAIRRDLLALRDPANGAAVVTSVSRRDEIYSGPWWKEGKATRKVRGEPVEVEHDGFADLFLGYAPYYRVAWSNTMGGLDSAAVTDNTNHWSGDHVSVDPSHVPGVLLSNRGFTEERSAGLIDIGPTMLARYGIDPAPPTTDMDGRALPFVNITR